MIMQTQWFIDKNDLLFVEICIPFTQGYFVPGLVEIGCIDFKSQQYIVTVTITPVAKGGGGVRGVRTKPPPPLNTNKHY